MKQNKNKDNNKKELSQEIALHIIQRIGSGGQPPERGIEFINVGNESVLNLIEKEYLQKILRIGSSFKLVQGYYGGGKTHFLYCLRELAWRYNYATSVVELSPAECPFDDTLKVYQAIVRRIQIAPYYCNNDANCSEIEGLTDIIRTIIDDKVKSDGIENVRVWLQRTLKRHSCESPSYRNAFIGFSLAYLDENMTQENLIEAWLMGEQLAGGQLRENGIYETIERSNAFIMLRALTQMLIGIGLQGTALLFDEVDRNLSLSSRRKQILGDNLRQLIDLCGKHTLPSTLMIYAVPPEFMRDVIPEYPALFQRLKSPLPLSQRSPQSVLVDLEKMDLPPKDMLLKIAEKIADVFMIANNCKFSQKTVIENAKNLAQEVLDTTFEINHRRQFVKIWVDLLYRMLNDGEKVFEQSDILTFFNDQNISDFTDQNQEFQDA